MSRGVTDETPGEKLCYEWLGPVSQMILFFTFFLHPGTVSSSVISFDRDFAFAVSEVENRGAAS